MRFPHLIRCQIARLSVVDIRLRSDAFQSSRASWKAGVVALESPTPFVLVPIRASVVFKLGFFTVDDYGRGSECDYANQLSFRATLATKYANQGPALTPLGDLKADALFEQAAASEQASFDAVAHVLSYAKWFKNRTRLTLRIDAYEVILSKQAYVVGNIIFHLLYGAKVREIFSGLVSSRPHVAKWFESLEGRPSWQAVKDGITSWT
ncbi:hypothetical protein FIBSPDRAFT_890352 [Athelia psychrophila]|uniref:GST C-terminal domain-containing protein n=1 Tax=Athelia psychrophila TaxID=1759441 RepID=A0A166L160_9AGAM|nr:hypothetical protein FIBSPDRAFT_890352 [Fibularhizoctonia sp. CBS 109695]